eukprot:gene14040-15498_t
MVIIKCLVVGENGVGKKSLIKAFVEKKAPTNSCSTRTTTKELTPSDYHVLSRVDDREVDLQFWYCNGDDKCDRLRPLSYSDSSVVLLCFALDNLGSFERIKYKYIQEIRKHCGDEIPVFLIGTKSDVREPAAEESGEENSKGGGNIVIPFKYCKELAAMIHAISYIECSAFKKQWLDLVIRQASNAGYHFWNKQQSKKPSTYGFFSCSIS